MTEHQTRIALGIVIDDGNVLVIERQQREIGRSGKPIIWAFPGGKLESDESPEEAAVREVAEETGFLTEATGIIHDEDHAEFPVHVYYVACRLVGRAALTGVPGVIVATDWAPANSLDQLFSTAINPRVQSYLEDKVSR